MWALTSRLRQTSVRSVRHFSMLTMSRPIGLGHPQTPGKLVPQPLVSSSINQQGGVFQSVMGLLQKRFKSRGNTYQPNTLKRKRTFGFLARLRTKGGRKVLTRRKAKGRWYLTH